MGSFSSQSMIFVSGASRSGTTMLTRMLDRHSEICGLRETHYFGEFCDPLRDPPDRPVAVGEAVTTLFIRLNEGVWSRSRSSDDPAIPAVLDALGSETGAAEVFATAVAAFASRTGKGVPCEQTPRNIYYARALLEWYPKARFVHVLRDPRGVMASQKYRWRRRSLVADPANVRRSEQLRNWINYHPYTMTQLWRAATRLALELEDHPRFHLLRLEDLLREPEGRMRELCEFLGLDFDSTMLDIQRVNSSYIASASAGRGLDPASIDAWRGRLSRDELGLVHRRCHELMHRAGYASEPSSMSWRGAIALGLRYLAHAGGAVLVNPKRLWIQARALLRAGAPSAKGAAGGVAGEEPREAGRFAAESPHNGGEKPAHGSK